MTKRLGAILVFMFMLMTAQPVWAACSAPAGNAGDVVYNGTEKTFQYCNDTNWIAMNQPGSGAGGCTNPTANEGDILYNQDHRVLQGCVGNVHKAMGPVEGGDKWVMTSQGLLHGCGIKTDGSAWCWGGGNWGSGTYGKLGNGTENESAIPVKVSTTGVTGSRWIHISAGETHSCGVRDNNTGWCWGQETEGRLGNNSTSGTETFPVGINGGHSWAMISAGGSGFSCGVRTDGAGYCWGINTNGRLGIGGSLGSTFSTPQAIAGGYTWKSISAGGNNHACGIISNDDGYCWGAQQYGKLGDGTSGVGSTTSPSALLGGFKWQIIKAGDSHSCGITLTGVGYCWGTNGDGQLGDGTTTQRTSPTAITGGGTWLDIAPSGSSTCGIKDTGQAFCWGWGYVGDLGDYVWDQSSPTPIYGSDTWISINAAPDGSTACAIRTQGDLFCWGSTAGSGATDGSTMGNNVSATQAAPTKTVGDYEWANISAGGSHTCGVQIDGSGWCWGSPANEKSGLSSPYSGNHNNIPRPLSGAYTWITVQAGGAHTCGLVTDGTIRCWGIGGSGQIGNGNTSQTPNKTLVDLATNSVTGTAWIALDSDTGSNCAIRNDNSLWCWGAGAEGRMGDGDVANNNSPNIVSGGYSWAQVSTGTYHTCGVQTNGTGWCWGSNGNGRLGDNGAAAAQQTTPFQVSGGYTWKKISSGNEHSCGIRTDGTLMCWGEGGSGRLGTGNSTDVNVPTAISGGGTWLDVHAGFSQTCALKSDKTIWCWGSDQYKALGNGETITGSQNTPQPIAGGGTWNSLALSELTACAINTNKSLWCWGQGNSAQLGDGKTGISNLPSSAWCSEPRGKPGAIVFNSTEGVLQYCDGVSWTGAGGAGAKKTVLPSSGLVGYWKFDASSGTAVADSSGNGNHGTMNNMDSSSDWVAGRFGNGLDFDGVDDFVNVGNPATLNDLYTRTICAWVYPRPGGTGTYKQVVFKYDNAGQTGWDMYYSGSAQSQGGVGYIEPSGQVTNNQWQHFCVTSDGVNLEGYKNGVNTTPGGQDPWGSAGSDSAYPLTFGGTIYGNDPFNGVLDEIRIYNRVLTLEEIQTLANQ